MEGRKVYVLDTTAILATQLEPGAAELVTVQDVVEEVVYGGLAPQRLATALAKNVVRVRKPSKQSVEKVSSAAVATGDLPKLSKADINLLAAACDEQSEGKRVVVLSDDYSLQNTALTLGLEVAGIARMPVRSLRKWSGQCKVCGKVFDKLVKACPVCGGEVVRRVKAADRG
ncbi:MAG: NOB1 family endonuclease [Candidatus Caldarchaeum sp.]